MLRSPKSESDTVKDFYRYLYGESMDGNTEVSLEKVEEFFLLIDEELDEIEGSEDHEGYYEDKYRELYKAVKGLRGKFKRTKRDDVESELDEILVTHDY